MRTPLRVAVTGAAGNIGYSLLWRIASGECFGEDQPISLQLLEIPQGMERLEGVAMELVDSAFPLVFDIDITDDARKAFDQASGVFLVGSRPRSANMDRADLVKANGPIFVGQGRALNDMAANDVRVVVVGNPCNTNCLIAQHNAPDIPPERFTAMTRLDQNRAAGQLAARSETPVVLVRDVVVWGNHSDKMYPDVTRASIDGVPVTQRFDQDWLRGDFMKTVATRGKAIIQARGASSAASAASAAVDHMRDWWHGAGDRVVSMAVPSKGWYEVPKGLIYSFPCLTRQGNYEVIEDWKHDAFGHQKLVENVTDLEGERVAVEDLL